MATVIEIALKPEGRFSLAHKHKHKHNQPKILRENSHKISKHVPFFLCLYFAYVALVSSENEDKISTSINTRR